MMKFVTAPNISRWLAEPFGGLRLTMVNCCNISVSACCAAPPHQEQHFLLPWIRVLFSLEYERTKQYKDTEQQNPYRMVLLRPVLRKRKKYKRRKKRVEEEFQKVI